LATAVRPLADLQRGGLADTHIAMLSDLSRPCVRAFSDVPEGGSPSSLSLYGLIARFVSSLGSTGDGLVWRYSINAPPPVKADEHPSDARLSNLLFGMQRAILTASGHLLGRETQAAVVPSVDVVIDAGTSTLLEEIHAHADWVITIDRFFGIDY